MTTDSSRSKPSALLVGHSGRLMFGTKTVTLVFLGQIAVFVMALLHDEFIEYLVETGRIAPQNAVAVEVIIGIVLFVFWLLLTVAFARILNTAPKAD